MKNNSEEQPNNVEFSLPRGVDLQFTLYEAALQALQANKEVSYFLTGSEEFMSPQQARQLIPEMIAQIPDMIRKATEELEQSQDDADKMRAQRDLDRAQRLQQNFSEVK